MLIRLHIYRADLCVHVHIQVLLIHSNAEALITNIMVVRGKG